jgi:hypothetical protein
MLKFFVGFSIPRTRDIDVCRRMLAYADVC